MDPEWQQSNNAIKWRKQKSEQDDYLVSTTSDITREADTGWQRFNEILMQFIICNLAAVFIIYWDKSFIELIDLVSIFISLSSTVCGAYGLK